MTTPSWKRQNSSKDTTSKKKILAVDTFYYEERAKTVGVLFNDWSDSEPEEIISSWSFDFGPYIPGEFYLREMPPIIELLSKINMKEVGYLIVDGFLKVYDERKGKFDSGLGYRLMELLQPSNKDLVFIGIAKSDFGGTGRKWKIAEEWNRGPKGSTPLWVQVEGMRMTDLMKCLKRMPGEFRLPDMLRILDKETKKEREN